MSSIYVDVTINESKYYRAQSLYDLASLSLRICFPRSIIHYKPIKHQEHLFFVLVKHHGYLTVQFQYLMELDLA